MLKPCTSAKCNDGICCNILTQHQEHKERDEGSGEDDDRTEEDSEDDEAAFC